MERLAVLNFVTYGRQNWYTGYSTFTKPSPATDMSLQKHIYSNALKKNLKKAA